MNQPSNLLALPEKYDDQLLASLRPLCLCIGATESMHLMCAQFSVVSQLPFPFCQFHTQAL